MPAFVSGRRPLGSVSLFDAPLGKENAAPETSSPPLVGSTLTAGAKLACGSLGLQVNGMHEMHGIDDGGGGDEEVAGTCLQDAVFPTL